jgi:aryl-alcohol dehydrogenase-like predicted oxidoreductase
MEFTMQYRLLGKSGLRVSAACLGTMTFGEDWGWGASKEDSRQIFDLFVEAGGNFIDTAVNYTNGSSERLVGEFLRGRREQFVVASKYTLRRPGADPGDLNGGGNHRKNLRHSVEDSLRRLETDYLDVLYLHIWDFTTGVDEVLRALDDLVSSGKVLHLGVSDTPAWIVARAQAIAELRGWSQFVAYQGEYNLLQRGLEYDVLPMTRELGMAVLAFGLLSGGVLSGKFNQPGGPGAATRRQEPSEKEKAVAAAVMEVATELGCTPSQAAIAWDCQRSAHIIPLLGARRPEQLRDNLGALAIRLSPEQFARLEAANPLPPVYPHSFWIDYVRRELIFGEQVDSLS